VGLQQDVTRLLILLRGGAFIEDESDNPLVELNLHLHFQPFIQFKPYVLRLVFPVLPIPDATIIPIVADSIA
jgi:hypothetical protein